MGRPGIVSFRQDDRIGHLLQPVRIGQVVVKALLIEDKDEVRIAKDLLQVLHKACLDEGVVFVEAKAPGHVGVGAVGEENDLRRRAEDPDRHDGLRGLDIAAVDAVNMQLPAVAKKPLHIGRAKRVCRVRKIGLVYPEKLAKIRESLRTLSACERKNVTNLDLLAGTFGDIMAEILAYKSTRGIDWSEELRRLGYQLGKFIYILDAYDDVQEDIEKNRFNPLKELYHELSKEQFDNYVKEILMMIATDMAKIYECLPIVEETAILRNIIYSGIWVRFMTKQNDAGNGKQ